jgi:hypothetical protein
VLRRHACIADVIVGFDVDACQLAYDGSRVLATPSALRALRSGINIADPERSSPSYERRLSKYALRGFAVAVPGLRMDKVSKRYTSGCFTYIQPGSKLRKVLLSFTSGDLPTYTVDVTDIRGLPKLLVLSTLQPASAAFLASQRVPPWRRSTATVLPPEGAQTVDGCFLLNFDKLSRYGKKADEVWRRPTPPAPPPSCLLEQPRARRRQEVLASGDGQQEDYSGPGIPYGEEIVPSHLVDDEDEDWGQPDQSGLIPQLAYNDETGVCMCWDLIRNVSVQDPALALPNVEDAARRSTEARNGSEALWQRTTSGLPRHIEFPSSIATGETNPYARLPADEWFADVYGD